MTLYIILSVILAYLLGAIPTSVWLGKVFFNVDVRDSGSGNAGATNTIRVLGWKAGIPVLIFDIFKGWLAVSLADWLIPEGSQDINFLYLKVGLAVSAVLGHIFPVYISFRGGRGVATLLGIGIALYPVSVWMALGVFILVLVITRIVSLSSILAAVSLPFFVYFVCSVESELLKYLSIGIAVFIPLTHYSNIVRLINNQEKQFSFKKDKSTT